MVIELNFSILSGNSPDLSVMGKVLQEEISQESRIIATIETDLGLQTIESCR